MKKTKELSDKQKAERKAIADYNRKYAGFKRSLKTKIKEGGIRGMELQLEFLRNNPNTCLPKKTLGYNATIQVMTEAIDEYKESYGAINRK